MEGAPTRWGRVSLHLQNRPEAKTVVATVELARPGAPKELHVKLRMPRESAVTSATVNGRRAAIGGIHGDTVVLSTGSEMRF